MPVHNAFYMTSPFKGPERFKRTGDERRPGDLTRSIGQYNPPGMGDAAAKLRGKPSASFRTTPRQPLYAKRLSDVPAYAPPSFGDGMCEPSPHKRPSPVFRSQTPRMPVPYTPSAAVHVAPYDAPSPVEPKRQSAVFQSRTGRMFDRQPKKTGHYDPATFTQNRFNTAHSATGSEAERVDAQSLASAMQRMSVSSDARLSHMPRVRGYSFELSHTPRMGPSRQTLTAGVDYRSPKTFVDEILSR